MSKDKNNLTVKIFALIIAIVLWGYVMSEVDPKQERKFSNIKVEYLNVEKLERKGLKIIEPTEMEIKVTVSGKRSNVMDLSAEDIIAEVDLSGYQEGDVKVPVVVDVPYTVEIVDSTPKEILFKLDKVIENTKAVTVETEGQLPDGYVLGEPEIKPETIYIEGARSLVNSVSKVSATIDITDRTEDINVSRPINLLDDDGNEVIGVEKGQNMVDIFIPVYETKDVSVELQTEGQLPDNYEVLDISVNPSTVKIQGKKDDLKDLNSIKTKLIDINSLIGKKDIELELNLPENISLVDSNGKVKLTLNVDESKTKTLKYNLNDIKIKNLNPDLIIDEEEVNTSFEITVRGSSSKIDLLKKEDLTIDLDLKDLGEGTHSVSPIVGKKDHIEMISILPESFDINLIAIEKEPEEEKEE